MYGRVVLFSSQCYERFLELVKNVGIPENLFALAHIVTTMASHCSVKTKAKFISSQEPTNDSGVVGRKHVHPSIHVDHDCSQLQNIQPTAIQPLLCKHRCSVT